MELFDVLDKNGNELNYTKGRNEELAENEYALVTHLWIRNSKGEILTQQRSLYKKVDPGFWSITAGFVSCGEDTIHTIARELKEELGVRVELDELKLHKRMFPKSDARHNHIVDVYILEKDVDLKDIVFQFEEVMDATYRTEDEMIQMMSNKEFMDFRTYYDNYYDGIIGGL